VAVERPLEAQTTALASEAAGAVLPDPGFDPGAVPFDHHDPTLDHRNVWDRYRELRERCPVARGERYGGYWVLSRYEDVKAAAQDHETFSSAAGMFLPAYSEIRIPPIEYDPPEHTWMRRLISPMTNAAVARGLEPDIQATIDALLGAIEPAEPVDLVERFALPLPLHVMTSLWGLTGEQGEDARRYSMAFLRGGSPELQRGVDYWLEIVAERKTDPRDDFVSRVLALNEGRMDDETIAILMWSLTYAGHDSTALSLGNVLAHLAEHPEDRAWLLEDRSRIPAAVNELLRFYTPLHQFRRTVARPTCVRGVGMQPGDPVLLVYASANRDEAVFADAERVHLDREENPHLAFGAGIHACPGRFLALTELRLAVETLLTRFPRYRLAGPVERTGLEGGGRHLGVRRLPVVLEPAGG